jgi:tetratricopeptide (TPR) repeat protein
MQRTRRLPGKTWSIVAAAGAALACLAVAGRLPSARSASPQTAGPITAPPVARAGDPAPQGIDGWVARALAAVKQHPAESEPYRMLATAYMRKQRQCGDPDYYRRAEAAVRKSLELEPGSYDSRKLLCWVLAGEHRFAEARELSQVCIEEHPEDWWNYGNLADAEMELGDYPAAVAAVQRMVDRKPNLSSYARAAHLRELHGDPEGALEALAMALDAGSARDAEALAWCRVQKGQVLFNMGRPREADEEYARALELQAGYHLALAGRARCRAALGHAKEAVALYEQALRVIPRPDWLIALGNLKAARGDRAGASEQYALARSALQAQPAGPDRDRQMAALLADEGGDPQQALLLARRAAGSRGDIATCDTLAWALYRSGRHAEGWQASLKARRLGTRDALLFYHAARIAARLPGHAAQARPLLRRTLATNPYFDPRYSRESLSSLLDREQGRWQASASSVAPSQRKR